jgi:hypothetical protein
MVNTELAWIAVVHRTALYSPAARRRSYRRRMDLDQYAQAAINLVQLAAALASLATVLAERR